MLGYLYDQFASVRFRDANGFVDLRQLTGIKTHIQNGANDLRNLTSVFYCHFYLISAAASGMIVFFFV
jgi:hypothetical protein